MKTYRTKRILTTTALYIIESEGNCANVDCSLCPLKEIACTTVSILSQCDRKHLLMYYLLEIHGEQKTKELITEALV